MQRTVGPLLKNRIFLPDLMDGHLIWSPSLYGFQNSKGPLLMFYSCLRGYRCSSDFKFRLPALLLRGEKQYWRLFFRHWLDVAGIFRLRIRVAGSGTYFFVGDRAQLFGVLTGTSHSCFFCLSGSGVSGTIMGRKKRILCLESSSLAKLHEIGALICRQRTPDDYKGKGLRFLYQKFLLKTGKKKFV